MTIAKISKQKKRLEVTSFEIDNPVVYEFFSSLPTSERDEKLLRALYIGVLALMEDRISSFLSKTSNELGTELESLKLIFEMKQDIFFKSAIKGVKAEEEIVEYLNQYFKENDISDEAMLTGNTAGQLSRNKTGDIVCFVNQDDSIKVVIECKFDKNIRLGDIKSKDVFTNKTDTAWSQLIEAQANRGADISMIVLDVSIANKGILDHVKNLRYIPSIGFIVIVDSQNGDYTNLAIAYMLSREIAINAKPLEFDKDLLGVIVNRMIKDINEIFAIRKLVHQNISNNNKILEQLEKGLLLMEFSQKFLARFLDQGTLTREELLDFYYGDEVKDQFKQIEKSIKEF